MEFVTAGVVIGITALVYSHKSLKKQEAASKEPSKNEEQKNEETNESTKKPEASNIMTEEEKIQMEIKKKDQEEQERIK